MIPELINNHVQNKQNVQHLMVFATGYLSLMANPIEIQCLIDNDDDTRSTVVGTEL